MKSEDCIKILDENLWVSAQHLYLVWRFTDPHNTSKSVTAWLKKKKIPLLTLSSMSFDFENPRQELKVWKIRLSSKNLLKLERVIIEELKKIPEKTCSNLKKKKNFSKRLQQVKKMWDNAINCFLQRFVPDYAAGFRLGQVRLPEALCHRRSRRR